MSEFLQPDDFDPTVLYTNMSSECLCGACIRAYFGMHTENALREFVPTKMLVTDCVNFDIGCANQEKD